MNSNFLTLNWKDIFNGILSTIFGTIITGVTQQVTTGQCLDINSIKASAVGGLVAGGAYLSKTLLSNSNRDFFTPEKTNE